MNKQQKWISGLIFLVLISFLSNSHAGAQASKQTPAPFLGWNSYNCYGSHINEKLTYENLIAFIQKLKPYGYEYFVLDAGWYRHYDLKPGEIWPTDGDKKHLTMDMIPFGHIRINYPLTYNKLETTRGYERMDYFSYAHKKTFITQRAMAASPLFMGGALTSSPNIVFELITNADMLECNQNGITGELVSRISDYSVKVDIWKTPHKNNANEGWIGVFKRNEYMELIKIDKEKLGLNKTVSYNLYDIWGKKIMTDSETFIFEIPGNDVVFIHFTERKGNS